MSQLCQGFQLPFLCGVLRSCLSPFEQLHTVGSSGVLQGGRLRLIDPLCPQNETATLSRTVPMPTASGILARAHITHDFSKAEQPVVSFTKRVVKRGRAQEKEFEKASHAHLLRGEPFPEALLKPPQQAPACPAEDSCEPEAQRRRVSPAFPLLMLAMVVVDIAKAYYNCPVRFEDLEFNRIVVWSHVHQRYFCFQSFVSLFGNKNSVVSWCRVACGLKSVLAGLLHVLFDPYVDDFPGYPPADVAEDVLFCFLYLLSALGLPFARRKARTGIVLEVLGLVFDMSQGEPCFYISESRRGSLLEQIDQILLGGGLSMSDAQILRGRLFFVFSSLVDRTFNPLLRPLSLRADGVDDAYELSNRLKDCLFAARKVIATPFVRKSVFEPLGSDNILLYTDASWSHQQGWIAGVFIDHSGVFQFFRLFVVGQLIHISVRKRPINFLEAATVPVAVRVFASAVAGQFFWALVDNDSAKDALLNQGSSKASMRAAAFEFWQVISSLLGRPWISRIPTHLNIADIFTRESRCQFALKYFPQMFREVKCSPEVSQSCIDLLGLGSFSEFASIILDEEVE